MADSDAALIARVVMEDDRAAFELLVRRHQSPLRAFLRRLARNDPARADDLAQETLMKLYTSIGTYKAQAKFTTWLYRIAYNTFLNDQRGQMATSAFDTDLHAPAHDSALDAGNEKDVEYALSHLSDRQRAIFDLHYRKGMSHQEIASALDMPAGTVKSDLSRGLEVLRRILAGKETH